MEISESINYLRKDVFTYNTQNEKLLKFLSDEEHGLEKLEEQFREITKIPVLEIDEFATYTYNKKKIVMGMFCL